MNTVIVENKNSQKKEFRVLLKIECDKGRKYIVFTDERKLNDGSLHVIVTAINSKNNIMKTRPTIEDMKYIEKLMSSLCKE